MYVLFIAMNKLLKTAREQKNIKTRELAQLIGIDQALISKFESGSRKPTKEQIKRLSEVLEIKYETLIVEWIKERILHEIKDEEFGLKALQLAEVEAMHHADLKKETLSHELQNILSDIDSIKKELNNIKSLDCFKITQSLELEYTFESNKTEGNTLTLHETDLIVNEGTTVSGKSMREHLEAINHQEAIHYIQLLVKRNFSLNERELLSIHNLILRGIVSEDAGKYRKVQVLIKDSSHLPLQPYLISKAMEDYFLWFLENKNKLHPIILAAEMHKKLVAIHPFIEGNGKISRLIMNLILLQHGYVIANIKGDYDTRMNYYKALEKAQTSNNKENFLMLIAQTEKDCLERYLSMLKQ